MQSMFRGNTTWAEAREQERKARQDELGVCRIRRIEENRNSQTLGSGFVVKDLPIIPGVRCPYCLISSDKVFPNGCNIETYYLDFRKLKNTQDLKTIKLKDVAESTHINRFSGFAVIPINPSKKCDKNQSIFTYRPFKVDSEGSRPNEDLRCHFVDDGQAIFSVKWLTLRSENVQVNIPTRYQLHEVNDRPYTTYDEVTRRGDRKPYGAAILKRSTKNNEFMVAGALTFTDDDRRDISPVFFPGFFRRSTGEEWNVSDPANVDEVVTPDANNGASRDEDSVSGHEHHNQEINAATAGRTEAPNLNREATVPAAAIGEPQNPVQTVPTHQDETNLESLTGTPIQVKAEDTVDEGATGNETAQQPTAAANSYDHLLVSDVIEKDIKFVEDKLAPNLDYTSRAIKNWEHLACTKEVKAPLETRLRCKLNNQYCSRTQMLIDFLAAEMTHITVQDLIAALKAIKRNDVVEIITAVYPEKTISDFNSSESEMIEKMATKLDPPSCVNGNWKKLGGQFKVPGEKLKEIEYGPFNPALVLMEHLYSTQEHLTVGKFYEEVKKLKRGDVLKKLKPFLDDHGEKLMESVIELESDDMRGICIDLNNPKIAVRNWRHLARAFNVPREIYKDFNPEKPLRPTNLLFEWISANRRDLTVRQLRAALESIDRNDVVRVLRKYLDELFSGQE